MMRQLVPRCLQVIATAGMLAIGLVELASLFIPSISAKDLAMATERPSEETKPPTWTIKHRLHHDSGVTTVAMNPSGTEVAAGGILSPLVSIWDVETGRLVRHIKGLKGSTQVLAYSPDGKSFAVGRGMITSADICVFLFQAGTGTILQRLVPPPIATSFASKGVGMVESLQYSPDSQFLAVTFRGGGIGIYEVATGQLIKRKTVYTPSFGALAYSPDGKYLAFGQWKTREGRESEHFWSPMEIQLLDTSAEGGVVKTFPGHTDLTTALAFDPRGHLLASGSTTGQVQESLDPKTNHMVRKQNDDPIRLWDVEAGMLVKELVGHRRRVTSLVFIEDGQILVSGSYDKTIKVWDVPRGTVISTLTGHDDYVASVAVNRNSKYLASGGGAEIKIWQRD
ncbi:MAG: WD40 repeat domain-containing protein [Nitrospira sp.]